MTNMINCKNHAFWGAFFHIIEWRRGTLYILYMYIAKQKTPKYRFCKTHLFMLQNPGLSTRKTRVSAPLRPGSYGSHTLWLELQDMGLSTSKTRVFED